MGVYSNRKNSAAISGIYPASWIVSVAISVNYGGNYRWVWNLLINSDTIKRNYESHVDYFQFWDLCTTFWQLEHATCFNQLEDVSYYDMTVFNASNVHFVSLERELGFSITCPRFYVSLWRWIHLFLRWLFQYIAGVFLSYHVTLYSNNQTIISLAKINRSP